MCGIVAFLASTGGNVVPRLLLGLERLEYRGYDSAGLAVIDDGGALAVRKAVGKVEALRDQILEIPLRGNIGIAHTRWATHGPPSLDNAHPHLSGGRLALVHNGIIENHARLRAELMAEGFDFASQTDSEVIVHLIYRERCRGMDLPMAVRRACDHLEGAYAFVVIDRVEPTMLVGARSGCPLVLGFPAPDGELTGAFASDPMALAGFAPRVLYLEEGDVVRVTHGDIEIYDHRGTRTRRTVRENPCSVGTLDKRGFRHYMLKEIYEQPEAVARTLESRLVCGHVPDEVFGPEAHEVLSDVAVVHFVACGTSHHAALLARRAFTQLGGLETMSELASEYRHFAPPVHPKTLLVAVSQSGETADTLAAVRHARTLGYRGLVGVCNVAQSSLLRETSLSLVTRAGPEIGVASTKTFTTQVVGLQLLALALSRHRGGDRPRQQEFVSALQGLPGALERALQVDEDMRRFAEEIVESPHALFIGRGDHYPVALEGALKLKEISYIHAEAYAAGELKHGPLALVDHHMPVVALVPRHELFDKMAANLAEVAARGGRLLVLTDAPDELPSLPRTRIAKIPGPLLPPTSPLIFTVALQLLAYHAAVAKGTDVDQPRNLAKSVTVE